MADALAAVTWHLNEYVRSILSGFRSPFERLKFRHLPPGAATRQLKRCLHLCTYDADPNR